MAWVGKAASPAGVQKLYKRVVPGLTRYALQLSMSESMLLYGSPHDFWYMPRTTTNVPSRHHVQAHIR